MKVYLSQEQILRAKRRRLLKAILFSFSFLGFLGGVFYLVVWSPVFRVKTVEITGYAQLGREEILKSLETEMLNDSVLAAVLGSDNILFWNRDGVLAAARRLPAIESLSFSRDLPERTVKITVRERQKSGIWCENKSPCFWFDGSGVIFKEAPSGEGFIVFKVNDFSGRSLAIGQKVLEENFLENFFGVSRELANSGLNIREIRVNDFKLQEFEVLTDGPRLLFSFRFFPVSLGDVLLSIKKNPDFAKLEYADFRVGNRLYYR